MATGRKKCICQICTCGKHICPHRKQGILTTKSLQNGDLQKEQCQYGHQQKGQSVDEAGKIKSKASPHGRRGSSESKTIKAKKVQGKGNGQNRWSAKQIAKTMAIRHPDNLKSEGSFELTTTTQHDFTEKEVGANSPSKTMQAAGARVDSWSKRTIKQEDHLKPSGSLDLKTTHGESYTNLTPVELSPKVQQDNENLNGTRKIKKQRPKTSLRQEGSFQSETLYQKDFSPREPALTPTKHRPPNHLKPEGPMYFEPTSADYNADILQAKTEDGQIISPRPRNARPRSTLKAPSVPIDTQTTNSDYKRWEVEKPTRRRPEDTLKRLQGPESVDEEELLEQIKHNTYHENYSIWNVNRPVIQKPTSNLRAEGDIDFETTHHADYVMKEPRYEAHEMEKTRASTPTEEVTTGQRHTPLQDARSEQISPQSPELAEMPSPVEESQRESSEAIVTTKKEDEVALSAGSSSDQMLTWEDIRPQPVRPRSNLRQDGCMEFDTTNRREFIQRPIERVKGFRPQTSTKISGEMETITTNQAMLKGDVGERVNPIRPKSNIHLEEGIFNGETTSAREFKEWALAKPNPILHKSTLAQEGDMTFMTTHHSEFEPKSPEKVYPIRPQTTNNVYDKNGKFDGMTTSSVMHPKYESEKVDSIRPESNLKPNSGSFNDETTNRREFQQWDFDRMSPFRPSTNMKQEGDMDFTTMNQVQFKKNPLQERVQPVIHPTNLHTENGKFSDDVTSRREFQEWKLAKPLPYTPRNNLAQEGEFDFTTVNQTQFFEKPIQKAEDVRPHTTDITTGDFDGTTTNRSTFKTLPLEKVEQIRHEDNLRVTSGIFNGETTAGREFVYRSSDRPEPIRPKPNLSQEGDFDFTTSNQRDFEAKTMTKMSPIRPQTKTKLGEGDFYSTTTNQASFGMTTLQPVKPIVPQSNLEPQIGEFYNNTTTREQYQPWKIERPAPVIYSDNLKQEGQMQFETTNRTEFVERSVERPELIRPQTTTKIEGDIDATTTNQVMYSGHFLEKVHPIRQKDNLHLESGKFSDETTNKREFRQWIKPNPRTKAIKPLRAAGIRTQGSFDKGNSGAKELDTSDKAVNGDSKVQPELQNGESQRSNFTEELAENVEKRILEEKVARTEEDIGANEAIEKQPLQEYRSKPIARVKAIAPVGNIKQDGTMNFSTTTGTEFTEKLEQAKVDNLKLKTDHEPWQLAQDDTDESIRYSKQKADIPTRPMIHKRTTVLGKDIDVSESTQVSYSTAPVIKAPKRFKPSDNLKPENVPFDADSTTRTEFKKWDTTRSSSKKRSPMLKQEGEMQFQTTADDYSRELFQQNGRLKPRLKKPQENLKLVGDMNLSTTTQSSYVGNITPKTKNLRPKSSLKIGGDPDSHTETPPFSFRKQAELTTDITKSSHPSHVLERTRSNRPTTSQKVGGGRFEGITTTQSEFKAMPMLDKTRSFKPESSHVFNGGSKFQGNTTYRCTYDTTQGVRCPVLDLESNVKYQFKEEVNGHRFYLPLVQG